ncbi:hypothetical protein [Aquimarina rhabdastrellae]
MKNIILLLVCILSLGILQAQNIPDAFNYQAIAKDAQGNAIKNQKIGVQIQLQQGNEKRVTVYTETHQVITDTQGLFVLQIGKGNTQEVFSKVNWGAGASWLQIAIDTQGGEAYKIIGSSELLSVPYALYAKKSGSDTTFKSSAIEENVLEDIDGDTKIVIKNDADDDMIKIHTEGEERFRLNKNTLEFLNNGESVGIGEQALIINNGARNNTAVGYQSMMNPTGSANTAVGWRALKDIKGGRLNVALGYEALSLNENGIRNTAAGVGAGRQNLGNENVLLGYHAGYLVEGSSNILIGTRVAEYAGEMNNKLYIENSNSSSPLIYGEFDNDLVQINGSLKIGDHYTFPINDGNAGDVLKTDGNGNVSWEKATSSLIDVNVSKSSKGFVASFENTDGNAGDGIVIKLGRTHGAWTGNSFRKLPQLSNILLGGTTSTVQGWFSGKKVKPKDLINMMPAKGIAEATAHVTNLVVKEINKGLKNGELVPPITIPNFNFKIPDVKVLKHRINISGTRFTTFPGQTIKMPSFNVPGKAIKSIKLPNIPLNENSEFDIPNLKTLANVNNSLNNENKFVEFQDKDGRRVGSIRAESMTNWRNRSILDDVYITNVAASFVGVDLLDGITNGFAVVNQLIYDYNRMGVEYTSGNGDYAEWLEREDSNEYITAGDIVAVKGGKITKNLEGAEQIMAVSHKPIVLGNMPSQERIHLGHNVAFMGQIPVKVLGVVQSGDYIVADTQVKGYGKPIRPEDMTVEDFKYAVGRSWDNHPVAGMKMVNTVIGVHNGDWMHVIKKMQARQQANEQKINSLEASVEFIKDQLHLNTNDTTYED